MSQYEELLQRRDVILKGSSREEIARIGAPYLGKKFWFWQNRPYVVHPLTLADVKWYTY